VWDAISAYDILPNELLYLLGCNGGKRLVKVVAYRHITSGFSYANFVGVRWRVTSFEVLDVGGCPIVGLGVG